MYRILLLLCALLVLPAAELQHTKDPLAEVNAAIASGKAVLLDVREKNEWDAGHLQGALFVPLSVLNKGGAFPDSLPKDKPVYIHCRAGVRAMVVGKMLQAKGFDARPLKAGYEQLVEAGFPKAE